MTEFQFQHRAIDQPGSVTCPHCAERVSLPRTEPWMIVGGIAAPPESLVSFRCPRCKGRIYVSPVDEQQREEDARLDELDDESEGG